MDKSIYLPIFLEPQINMYAPLSWVSLYYIEGFYPPACFLPQFYIYLEFYIPFLFGLLFPFFIWTFISLFYLDFHIPIKNFSILFQFFYFLSRSHFEFLPIFFYQNNSSGFSFLDNYYFYFIRFWNWYRLFIFRKYLYTLQNLRGNFTGQCCCCVEYGTKRKFLKIINLYPLE